MREKCFYIETYTIERHSRKQYGKHASQLAMAAVASIEDRAAERFQAQMTGARGSASYQSRFGLLRLDA